MVELPEPRGTTSELLLAALRREAGELPDHAPAAREHPLADEDLQLSLYLAYELHYRGLPGVDERWEWAPELLALRARLEEQFERALLEELGVPDETVRPEDADLVLRALADQDGVSLSPYIEREATLDQVREFLIHRSAYQLKEADPHSWALPRLTGGPKAALVEIQADEYGGGRADRIHAQLFADAMDALDLDARLRAPTSTASPA